MAAVQLGNPACDGKPQSGASTLALIQPDKATQGALPFSSVNARPLITDRNAVAIALSDQVSGDDGVPGAVLYGVGEQGAHQGIDQCTMALNHCLMGIRSEEHTSELQSRPHLVCRLLLE